MEKIVRMKVPAEKNREDSQFEERKLGHRAGVAGEHTPLGLGVQV